MPELNYYFLKLNPPRASFTLDMTPEERVIMLAHVQYWAPFVQDGTVIVLGPVADPKGGYGISVMGVPDKLRLDELVNADPANGLCTYEIHSMRAVTKKPD
jgi:uncharacterized protein